MSSNQLKEQQDMDNAEGLGRAMGEALHRERLDRIEAQLRELAHNTATAAQTRELLLDLLGVLRALTKQVETLSIATRRD
jgi:VIT1/CCC1 family predicted Fe2+/Mn2+ transporter